MISDYEIEFLFKMQNDKCAWCGNLIDGDNFHLDHVVPIAFGGTNDPHNIVVSCNTCNHTKSDTCPGQFLESYRIGAPILAKKIVENAIGSHISMIERENLVEMAKQGVYKAKFSREK